LKSARQPTSTQTVNSGACACVINSQSAINNSPLRPIKLGMIKWE